jgi:pimeloyl-ACP methyl ester carboxylesterase
VFARVAPFCELLGFRFTVYKGVYRTCNFGLNCKVPVDVWQGDSDVLTSVCMAKYLAKHLPNSQLHIISDVGHYSLWERNAIDILQKLAQE